MSEFLNQINIRKMKESDLPLIEWNGEYSRYRRMYREVYRNLLLGISIPFVAENTDGELVGQAFLTEKNPNDNYTSKSKYMFLSSFRVKAPYRDKGLGTLILKTCEETVMERDLNLIFLHCASKNTLAKQFYEKHGFAAVRNDPGIWTFINEAGNVVTEKEPSIVMVKKIAN